MRIRVALGIVIATMSSCGGGGATAEAGHRSSRPAVSTRPATPAPAPRAHKAPVRHASAPGLPRINRRQLVAVIDGGLGRFLQGVVTEPELAHGRFVGFRLQSLYPDDPRVTAIDLKPGDVVVRVNGQPIERPLQALRVWNSLRVASELWIEYLRRGERRELRFVIE